MSTAIEQIKARLIFDAAREQRPLFRDVAIAAAQQAGRIAADVEAGRLTEARGLDALAPLLAIDEDENPNGAAANGRGCGCA